MKLSKAGYGDIKTIRELDIDKFMNLIHFENYTAEYSQIFMELNKNATRK